MRDLEAFLEKCCKRIGMSRKIEAGWLLCIRMATPLFATDLGMLVGF